MPLHPRKKLPAGFALREFSDGTYQAYRESDPSQASPRYTRRLQAVNWCWLLLGEEVNDRNTR
jgi:hypothetical protein